MHDFVSYLSSTSLGQTCEDLETTSRLSQQSKENMTQWSKLLQNMSRSKQQEMWLAMAFDG